MIDKSVVARIVNEWLKDKDYFLVSLTITPDSRITVEIDHSDGVWIEDCAELSRYIEANLDREKEDFELEVGSAGIGQPFKVVKQYQIHIGDEVETLDKNGKKWKGILSGADEDGFTIKTEVKVRHEGAKKAVMEERETNFTYDGIKYTKLLITFK